MKNKHALLIATLLLAIITTGCNGLVSAIKHTADGEDKAVEADYTREITETARRQRTAKSLVTMTGGKINNGR